MSDEIEWKGGMEAFDKLPPRLRRELAEFAVNMCSEFALKMLEGGKSEEDLIKMLRDRK